MLSQILTDKSHVVGQIYLIENAGQNKRYVGQTVSHRKNHEKYRPFGYEGRFKDHISEAICNTKKKQCSYLNNAIRLYGKDAFTVSLLHTCSLSKLDSMEQFYIEKYGTLYPNGYNLTVGGKVFKQVETADVNPTLPQASPKKRGGCIERTPETRKKMSQSLRESLNSDNVRKQLMTRTQQQHLRNKLLKFKGVQLDTNDLEQYITNCYSAESGNYIQIKVSSKQANFVGKYETIETLRQRAIDFLNEVANESATLPNCSGNP